MSTPRPQQLRKMNTPIGRVSTPVRPTGLLRKSMIRIDPAHETHAIMQGRVNGLGSVLSRGLGGSGGIANRGGVGVVNRSGAKVATGAGTGRDGAHKPASCDKTSAA